MDLGGWLRSLGLERYETTFRENDIDETVLAGLTAEDLKELGVASLGHRRKLLDAVAALRADASGKEGPSAEAPPTEKTGSAEDRAERRQVTVMFSDLVGSTALAARMDPEDLREVISAYQKCVAETVDAIDPSRHFAIVNWRAAKGSCRSPRRSRPAEYREQPAPFNLVAGKINCGAIDPEVWAIRKSG